MSVAISFAHSAPLTSISGNNTPISLENSYLYSLVLPLVWTHCYDLGLCNEHIKTWGDPIALEWCLYLRQVSGGDLVSAFG